MNKLNDQQLMIQKATISILFTLLVVAGYSQQQELKLWYNKPAVKWTDALPIGNGRLGAMIFGGLEKDRIQFNEETLWTGEPRDYHRKGAHKYLPVLRQLVAEGKQDEAEKLAEEHFMGLKSNEGKRDEWIKDMAALKGLKGNPALPGFDDSKWKEILVPTYEGWETVGYEGLDGALWFRTTFELPGAWKGKNLVLDLNRIRDQDYTYVNGKLVGQKSGGDARRYTIPADVLTTGKNTIAVQVLNFFDKGGIAGYKDTSRHIGIYPAGDEKSKLSLVKNWKFFVQNDNPPPVARFQADYQPFGDVYLNFAGVANATNYKRELDLNNAVVRTSYTLDGVDYTREYFASQPNQVIVIHVKANKAGKVNFDALLNSPHKLSSTKKIDDQTLGLNVQVRNGALKGESQMQVVTTKGTARVEGDKIVVRDADEVTLYIAAGTSFKNYKSVTANPSAIVKRSLQTMKGKNYEQVKAAHTNEYQKYFNTFSINFGKSTKDNIPTDVRLQQFASSSDPDFVALYTQYGRYLLISSSRPGTRPANLQGIWNDLLTPPWGSKYTTNINAEMNYWPAELLNLSPLHEPFFKMVEELAEAGRQTAKEHYNTKGWVLHHNTDLWRGTAPINASNHGIWVTGGAWVSQHLWEHYLFTQDKEFLRNKAYPIMKQSALFFNDFLVKDPKTGWLISTPSNSPEHGGLVAGPTMDHQIIRSLFKAVAEASEILNTDKELRTTLAQKAQQLAPNQIGKHGQLQEWLQDVDDPNNKHRHVSHLWAVYPGNEINFDANEKMMKAARQSLLYRGDAATGWSLGWKINLWARFKDGDHAYKLIQMLLSPADRGGAGSYTNLFDAHPPFQIDGNFGGAAGVGELLVQSHTQYIDLLPALPSALKTGEVKGIRARGGFELNLTWSNGKLQHAELLSNAGNDAVLRYAGKTVTFKTEKGKTYKLNSSLEVL
ncbi:glycoside hydrolase family 95 protein [Aridibaculum aurantiacum]|uniref:glycoside hydrolase family 95 protein n=1 Tax=Aridibaculum aurantiacum TaxID=2810307 RepID=UPI001F623073|nr:glycoside hydrolase N-terminal domain-containing protein [Aridibaculum aurantiacum]